MTIDVPLSAAIQSDLVEYHKRLGGSADAIGPGDTKLILARAVEAIADVRAGALELLDGAADLLEAGRPDLALYLLRRSAMAYRDTAPKGERRQ